MITRESIKQAQRDLWKQGGYPPEAILSPPDSAGPGRRTLHGPDGFLYSIAEEDVTRLGKPGESVEVRLV